jgi:hypothetical protein
MAENRLPTAAPANATKTKRGYVPSKDRPPVSVFTVMSRVKRMIDRLSPEDRAGAVAWLRGQYPAA